MGLLTARPIGPMSNTAAALDHADPLASYRNAFALPAGVIYLDGNSLGAMQDLALVRVRRALEQEWAQGLIRSWNTAAWITAPRRCGDKIAQLIGAHAGEVVACDTTSINIFKMLVTAIGLRPTRSVIVSDIDNFPTDLYIAQGLQALLAQRGLRLRCVKRQEMEAAIDDSVAVVMLTEVDYRTGERYDMQRITALAQHHGALTLWDLAHSTCAFPVALNACNVDLAVGCTYKYVNGGPGAPAFVFAAKRHLDALDAAQSSPPIAGWFAHATPFAFDAQFHVAKGIERFLVGTPPVLQFAALEAALDLWLTVDMQAVRAKSIALAQRFIDEVEQRCAGLGLTLATPRQAALRGSQVSFRHAEGYAIMQALIARGVIGDFRAPDILRFGLAPLYVRYEDVTAAAEHLREVLVHKEYAQAEYQVKRQVT